MARRWLGLHASTNGVIVVDSEVPADDGPIVIIADDTWRVQKGDRAAAYSIMYQQCADYVRENGIDVVIIKASAVPGKGSATLGLLNGAEVRGVVMAAAASQCAVRLLSTAIISRTYGARKVQDYVEDDAFWTHHTTGGALRKGSREAAMLLVAARND